MSTVMKLSPSHHNSIQYLSSKYVCACNIVPTSADDKMLSGEDEEAVVWEDSGKTSDTPVPTGRGLGKKCCALHWQVGDI